MSRSRRFLVLLVLVLASAAAACSTSDQVFPPNGSVRLVVTDTSLDFQNWETPSNQIVSWTLSEATADIEGFGVYDFLGDNPCEFTLSVTTGGSFVSSCDSSGLSLDPTAAPLSATIRVTVTGMEVIRARRPEFPEGGDHDGDGVLNEDDNCPLIANADQANVNEDQETVPVGDACSAIDPTTLRRTIPDQDADEIPDGLDNCLYVANTDQKDDSERNLIGDACEQEATVTLSSPLTLVFPDEPFLVTDGRATVLLVDFATAQSLTCNAAFTTCEIDETEVLLTVSD